MSAGDESIASWFMSEDISEIDQEDLVQRSNMVISVTNSGYIKRVPLNMYRAQKRGGKGRAGSGSSESISDMSSDMNQEAIDSSPADIDIDDEIPF